MKREKGFYWVKYLNVFEVMEWAGSSLGWLQCGVSIDHKSLYDKDLNYIDERVIINPNK